MSVVPLRPEPMVTDAVLEAEQHLLGALMYDNAILPRVDHVKPEMLYDPVHGAIWEEALSQLKRGLCTPHSVAEAMKAHSGVQELGGLVFLSTLVERAYPSTAPAHADMVVNAYRLRVVAGIADEIRRAAREGGDAFDLIAKVDRTFSRMVQDAAPASINQTDARTSALTTVDELDQEAKYGRSKGFMTGLRCFDRRMRGLRPGWLVVVAGRPSMGKTALARAAAFGAARRTKAAVVFFALEMAKRELDERTLSQLSHEDGDGIAYKDMNGSDLPPEQRDRLRRLAQNIPANFIIDDNPIMSVDYIRRQVLALKQRGPVAAVFIDYLQIMDRPDAKGRNEASVVGEMTKGLKQLAREAETCVVLLSQINRGVESRDDKRPQMSDLRESGAIEQDANAILFPYREAYYLQRSPPTDPNKKAAWETACALVDRKLEVYAAKVRQGSIGSDEQVYYIEYDAIEDAAE